MHIKISYRSFVIICKMFQNGMVRKAFSKWLRFNYFMSEHQSKIELRGLDLKANDVI